MIHIDEKILESKILIVDDDKEISAAVEDTLKAKHYQRIKVLNDPRQVVDTVRQFMPDIILLDINMPHWDGFRVMEEIRKAELGTFIPIVILTAETDEETCIRALRAGATDFLPKPMNITQLTVRVENMLKVRFWHRRLEERKEFLEGKVQDRTEQLKQAIRELDSRNLQLHESYLETIYALTRAAEYKDEETGDHVKRLSLYSVELGKTCGLKQEQLELLLYASPMHDIGKIGIPDHILFKKGGLTEEEWAVMKRHPIIGAEILSASSAPILKLAASIALNHHERWDGSGYPNGLKGEAIPVEARILAVGDVYDALRSPRPYKRPFSHEESCRIILEGDGRVSPGHFDPRILEDFRKTHENFRRIYEEYQN
ncbi:MAG: HD domain-containing phosphohydrolase [Candidatus Omnitrophota bacterium]